MQTSIELRIRLIYHDRIRRRLERDRARQRHNSTRFHRYAACQYATRSPFLRCAVHPDIQCETCCDYSPR
jgi:Family of unknown function (DUF6464)